MADAPEIKVKLTAEDTGVSAAIKELGNQLKNLKKTQDETAASGQGLATAFKGIVAVIAFEKIAQFGKAVLDSGTSIARASQITGASVQTLSVFRKTAEDLGVSTESVDKGFVKLSKSILAFQQGNAQATQSFAQLGISQKDFAGLNTDQKIKLVTDRLGAMADGTTKAALAQQLLGRGGAELIPVLNELAGEGFEKARASAEKLGLLLDGDMATSMALAKKSLTELGDVGKGIATQFTAGLSPAITDVANALTSAVTTEGVGGFKSLGEVAGSAMKSILIGIVAVVAGIVEIGAKTSALVQNLARATADAVTKGPRAAFQNFEQNELADAARIDAEIQARETALLTELQGKTREQDTVDEKAKAARRQQNVPTVSTVTPNDAAAKAALALLEKQLEDELEIHRAYAKQTEQIDKEMFDAGEMSLQEYYDRRRAEVLAESEEEIAITQKSLDAAKAFAAKAASESAKATAAKAPDADKKDAERLNALKEVDALETKIAVERVESGTKIQALNDQQFTAEKKSQQDTLAFEKELAELQGKRQQTAKADIDAQVQKRTLQIAQSGGSDDDRAKLTAELEQWKQLKLAVAAFEDAKDRTKQDTESFDIAKQGIEIKAKAGEISPLEKEREINELLKERLPLLQADAAAELGAAKQTGNQDNVADAQRTVQQMQVIGAQSNKLGTQIGQSLAGNFTTFFETVGRGTQSVAQSFEHLAASVIQSIEQMLIKLLLLKISSAAAGAGGGGGFLSSVFAGIGGHAEGGLIKGPGGPKDDRIPAMLSHGEFVVKADAVSSFGAHNLEAINRGLKVPSLSQLALPKFADGGLVGNAAGLGSSGSIKMGIGLDDGLILKHLSSKAAGRIILDHITNNPKAASKALGRSQG